MQFKHQDEYSFFSSGQARLTHELLYLHCGLIFVTFPSVFYLFLLMFFQEHLEDTRVKKCHRLYAVNACFNHLLAFGINKSSGQSTVNYEFRGHF